MLRLVLADNSSESPLAIAVRIWCTTSRDNPVLLVSYNLTKGEETTLIRQ